MPTRRRSRPATPETIRRQVVLEEHDVSPDGTLAVVVRRFVSGIHYRSHLWLVPLGDGGRPRQLTRGAVRDTRPTFAPDGRSIAFRRVVEPARGKEPPPAQVHVIGLAAAVSSARGRGQPPRPRGLTRGRRGVTALAWSPDGWRIAYTREADPPRTIVGPERAGVSVRVRRIGRVDWRYDGDGHLDRWVQLFVQEARPGAPARQLTHAEASVDGICWLPDGSGLVYAADPRPDADLHPRTSIWRVPADGGEPREVLAAGGPLGSPSVSPDGRWIAAVGVVDADALDDVSPGIVVGPTDGGDPVAVAPDLDRPIGDWVDTDLNGWTAPDQRAPRWADATTLVALVSDGGRCRPWRFALDPATGLATVPPEPLTTADTACLSLAVRGDRVTTLATLDARPMELLELDLEAVGGSPGTAATPVSRTRMGSAWMGGIAWPEMRSTRAPGPGGPIETWIASPAGAGDVPLPTVVDIHGGPLGAWAPAPHLEVVLLASRGYRVVLPNIRGSATYGRDWIRPQLGDWGGVDAADVHAAIDHAVALGLTDPERLGALGLSYGGFMVHWLIATSDRFRAAVAENGVADQVSAWAGSDTGPEYCRTSLLGDPLSPGGVAKLWRQSPLAHVADIRTPLLMLQAEADLRCPPSDNEQLFVALRHLRREVEYILYPEEHHTYSIVGRPDRRIDRMTRMLDWFDRHL